MHKKAAFFLLLTKSTSSGSEKASAAKVRPVKEEGEAAQSAETGTERKPS